MVAGRAAPGDASSAGELGVGEGDETEHLARDRVVQVLPVATGGDDKHVHGALTHGKRERVPAGWAGWAFAAVREKSADAFTAEHVAAGEDGAFVGLGNTCVVGVNAENLELVAADTADHARNFVRQLGSWVEDVVLDLMPEQMVFENRLRA